MYRRRSSYPSALVFLTEALEARVLPASTSISSGALTVKDIVGDVTVETTAVANQIRVTDGSGVVVLNGVTSRILIIGTNLGETIQFIASDGTQDFGGNIEIRGLNGDDTVDINGTIGGSVKLLTGVGVDTVTTTVVDVSIGGSLVMTDAVGANVFDMNGFSYEVGLAMTLSGVTTFDANSAALLDVGGALTISRPSSTNVPVVAIFSATTMDVGGAVRVNGGLGNDVVNVTSALSVGGAATLNLGEGNNTLVLTPAAGGTGITGNLTFTGKSGADIAVFGTQSVIGGNASLSLGGGINTFVDTSTSVYNNNLAVTGLHGTNTAVVLGAISGGLTVNFGNGGGNTAVVTGSIGTKFTFRLGNGTLGTLTLAPAVPAIVNIDAVFGTGDSSFNLGPNVSLTGKVTGKGGVYTFNQGTAILLPTLVFKNYP